MCLRLRMLRGGPGRDARGRCLTWSLLLGRTRSPARWPRRSRLDQSELALRRLRSPSRTATAPATPSNPAGTSPPRPFRGPLPVLGSWLTPPVPAPDVLVGAGISVAAASVPVGCTPGVSLGASVPVGVLVGTSVGVLVGASVGVSVGVVGVVTVGRLQIPPAHTNGGRQGTPPQHVPPGGRLIPPQHVPPGGRQKIPPQQEDGGSQGTPPQVTPACARRPPASAARAPMAPLRKTRRRVGVASVRARSSNRRPSIAGSPSVDFQLEAPEVRGIVPAALDGVNRAYPDAQAPRRHVVMHRAMRSGRTGGWRAQLTRLRRDLGIASRAVWSGAGPPEGGQESDSTAELAAIVDC
jgi:hypothetical protein